VLRVWGSDCVSVLGWFGLGCVGCVAAANGSVGLQDRVEGLARGIFFEAMLCEYLYES